MTSGRLMFFDLDGTLLSVVERYYVIHQVLCNKLNLKPMEKDQYWNHKRNRIVEEEILAKCGATESSAKELIQMRMGMLENLEYLELDVLHPSVERALFSLGSLGSLILVTFRKNRDNLLRQLKTLGIESYFETVINSIPEYSNNFQSKDALISAFLPVKKYECIFFGDTESDIAAGRKLGCKTVAVTLGIRDRCLLEECCPDHFINSWSFDTWATGLRNYLNILE